MPDKYRKDMRDVQIKTIDRSVLHKVIHVCSVHYIEDYFDESQELQWLLPGGKLRYLLKPDAVLSVSDNGKFINKTESFNIAVKDTEKTEFKKVRI